MLKQLRSVELPLVCQRQFEPSRVQEQLWSAAYEDLVPQGRRPRSGADSAWQRGSQPTAGVPCVSKSSKEQCA
jgi:hypothetical protein